MTKVTAVKEDSKVIAILNGLTIRQNSLYKVCPKLDRDAPNGYQKEGTTKLPSEGIEDTIHCRFKITNPSTGQGVYDTGFYEDSPCYYGLEKQETKNIVSNLVKHIQQPYEKQFCKSGEMAASNNDFWDNYSVSIYDGRVFNTANLKDLLDLYIAIQSFQLTPVSEVGSPKFRDSAYTIQDSSSAVSVAKTRASQKIRATRHFGNLLELDRSTLIVLAKYLKIIRPNLTPDNIDMEAAFGIWIDADIQNPENFLLAYEKITTEEGKEEVYLTVKLNSMISNKKIEKVAGQYVFKGVELGTDVRAIINNLAKDPDLADIKSDILLT